MFKYNLRSITFTKQNKFIISMPDYVNQIDNVMLLEWDEHCLECSAPLCYESCKYYVRRSDGKCQRSAYGLRYVLTGNNELPMGVQLKFSPWGKLQAGITNRKLSLPKARKFMKLGYYLETIMNTQKNSCSISKNFMRLFKYSSSKMNTSFFDQFVFVAYGLDSVPSRLILEMCDDNDYILHKTSFTIREGFNEFFASLADIDNLERICKIKLYPENNNETELLILLLDFVKYKSNIKVPSVPKKIKCVVWDCDNVLWKGILAENDIKDIKIERDIIDLIQEFDKKGIIQSISSKNDEKEVMSVLDYFSLKNYFIYPKINWERKSTNIKKIVSSLNIGMDTIAFIDDSEFEREEVKSNYPEIRVYSDKEIPYLMQMDEFCTEHTLEAQNRRKMYLQEEQRQEDFEKSNIIMLDFIMQCKIDITIFSPKTSEEILRCHELLNRTNQFNLSQNKYTLEEISAIIKNPEQISVCFDCKDKYGSYGIVGFAILETNNTEGKLKDFVMSCRVAKKNVENAFFKGILETLNLDQLTGTFHETERNKVLLDSLKDCGFQYNETQKTLNLKSECLSETIVNYSVKDKIL